MTDWAFYTMVVQAEHAPLARELAAALSPAGVGMFTSGLVPAGSATGTEPTHFISTGKIDAEFGPLLQDADALCAAGTQAGVGCGLVDVQALVATADVTDEPPFDAMARLGLELQQPIEEA